MVKKILQRKIRSIFTLKTLYIVVNLFFLLCSLYLFFATNFDAGIKCLVFLFLFLLYKGMEIFISDVQKEKTKIVRLNKRFTRKNEDTGAIEIDKKDLQQAILFLYEVENNI